MRPAIPWTRGLLAVLLLSTSTACLQTLELPSAMRGPAEEEPGQMDLRREYWDGGPSPRELRSEVEGLVFRGGKFQKHGRERAYFRGGGLEFERHWVRGLPAGLWLAWWENGTQRSECLFTPDGGESEMRFWHANGVLAAHGPAIHGRRTGFWQFFREDGSLESEGLLLDGLREGEWRFFDDCGGPEEPLRFSRGVRQ